MKRVNFLFFISLVLLFIGCQNIDEIEKPDNFLDKSKMTDLLYDMVLLDAAVSTNEKKLEELDVEMLEFLSKKYNIDTTDIKQNILYYNMQFDENTEIYEKVKDSIEKLEKAYDSISRVSDSLRKVELKKKDSIKSLESDPRSQKLKKIEKTN
ncbi:DUF4296 domain-containing protein [Psychroflexus sp. CAK8W]|uniref:DUF4296 domain-containing protein n=1 Tax=Psychroflexus longus TaxID=2873596 RepID=A0ABS7XEZ3_9FLAO|nr:DUF4296 domain-containing protein [Psychroflexus longus]MBZ9777517.1 DUF4296 domain-containing protein [Psychroflexus longus]